MPTERLRSCLGFLLALAFVAWPLRPAEAKWVVDQVYSNENRVLQFVVIHDDGSAPCGDLSFIVNGSGQVGYRLPENYATGRKILFATGDFADLGIVPVDFHIWEGRLGGGPGTIKLCDSVEFHYPALPVDGVTALDGEGRPVPNLATNSEGQSGSVTAAQAATALMHVQEGFLGAWYDPANPGQGFSLEVRYDWPSWDAQLYEIMVNWMTFDAAPGKIAGPEGQRWYTLYGLDGYWQKPSQLDIYRNVGGNFEAPPATAAEKVGTASLSFTACDRGVLEYDFSDGSGRSGRIPLRRLMQSTECPAVQPGKPDSDWNLSGNWFDADTPGQGLSVEISPASGTAFLAWYTYAPNGTAAGAAGQRWYTAQSAYVPGARDLTLTIYETVGGAFRATDPVPRTAAVGTATLSFRSCAEATFGYRFTAGSSAGATGTMALRRVMQLPDDCAP